MLDLHPVILEDLKRITQEKIHFEKLRGKTVLITGANGMIASYLIYTLLYLNDTQNMRIHVLGLVRNGEKARLHFAGLTQRQDFHLLVQDVCAPIEFDETVHFIVHAASQASPVQFRTDPVGTIRANTVGTTRMLELAADRKAEGFLMLSTREIYGSVPATCEAVQEDAYGSFDPTQVRACYPESKRMAETLCAAYAFQYGVPARVARIAHTYGPGIAIGDGRVVGDFLSNVIHSQDIVMNSDGSAVLGLTYISDVVAGLFLCLLDGHEFVYNVSSMDGVLTVRELAQMLAKLYPERNIGLRLQPASEEVKAGYLKHRVPLLDSARIIQEGWHPTVDIQEGFRRTIAYQESKL